MDDPYCGVDLDDCIHEGEVAPWATEIVEALDSYTEISPSGTGLKVYVLASKSGQRTRTGNIEMYDSGRFFTFTGRQYGDRDSIESRQGEIDELYRNLFPIIEPKGGEGEGFQGEDDALLSKARNVGQPYEFRALYDRGDWSTLDFRSQSEADFKLATMLAFWCGPDQDRIDALFRESALMRDKWDEPRGNSTYGELTIANAIDMCPYFYSGKVPVTDEVQSFLLSAYQWLMTEAWDYRSGPTDRHVYTALLDSAKASAALSRRCLQTILREKAGTTERDLAQQIQRVLDSGQLPSYLSADLDAVRNIGNFAAHPIKSKHTGEILPVELGEAEWNLDVVEALFDFYFVAPARAEERRHALNRKLEDTGKPLMKSGNSEPIIPELNDEGHHPEE
jgi:hypothetical protein